MFVSTPFLRLKLQNFLYVNDFCFKPYKHFIRKFTLTWSILGTIKTIKNIKCYIGQSTTCRGTLAHLILPTYLIHRPVSFKHFKILKSGLSC